MNEQVSEQMSADDCPSKLSSVKQVKELVVKANERMDEWVTQCTYDFFLYHSEMHFPSPPLFFFFGTFLPFFLFLFFCLISFLSFYLPFFFFSSELPKSRHLLLRKKDFFFLLDRAKRKVIGLRPGEGGEAKDDYWIWWWKWRRAIEGEGGKLTVAHGPEQPKSQVLGHSPTHLLVRTAHSLNVSN